MVEFQKKIEAMPEKLRQAMPGAFFQEAEEIMAESKQETPVDMGNLRASGHVQLPEIEGNRVSIIFGFGGVAGSGNLGETNEEAVGYAVPVHENLDSHHNVGNAKYLENPLNRRRPNMAENLAKNISERMDKI